MSVPQFPYCGNDTIFWIFPIVPCHLPDDVIIILLGVCLEQYLLLNRRNEASDEEHMTQQKLSRDIRVFICTTMYHEEDYEMEQLLRSIHDVDINSGKTGHQFEAHVFFDGCVRVEILNSYALKLASLVEKTLMVRLTDCSKVKTPYGIQLKWRLPGGMEFIIHLKDNAKVREQHSIC